MTQALFPGLILRSRAACVLAVLLALLVSVVEVPSIAFATPAPSIAIA